ncbi:hypothetical protein [Conexibacter arvalis]|uniref:Uncharacterized protein n=1 Tax=Conexibacter arvalis TaxID=912552 RepID=A0A840IFJ9_9ACTN|nr:hypothetical protein [Conexibacter arvalis]MBB4663599.1 hypothetical protein [Conexibacter arvalis]
MSEEPRWEQEEVDAAAAEAGAIGGAAGDEQLDPAERPVAEAGEGEAEGFEQAEDELIENASHGDQQSARVAFHDRGQDEDPLAADQVDAEADEEHSSEREDDDAEHRGRG